MTREIQLKGGAIALVDDEDWELVRGWNWYVAKKADNCHVRANYQEDGVQHYVIMHRLIMGVSKGQLIDHVNHNQLDNRRENLRLCTFGQNRMNTKVHVNSKTGVRNVYFDKTVGGFKAQVKSNGVKYQKRFPSIEEASAWAIAKRKELHGEFAYSPERDARLGLTG